MDDISSSHKNWAILLWGGSMMLVLGSADLRQYTIMTIAVPILFWFADGTWAHLQARFICREKEISDFLNSDLLQQSFEQRQLVGTVLLDPTAAQSKNSERYRQRVNYWSTANYRGVGLLYLGMMIVSMLVALILKLSP